MRDSTKTNLWSPAGIIHRKQYLMAGVLLVVLKWTVDAVVARVLFDRVWEPWRYLMPYEYAAFTTLTFDDRLFFGTLLLFSLPFAWIGVMLTVRRLRAAGFPAWLAALFFVPVVNVVLFSLLVVLPTVHEKSKIEERKNSRGSGRFAAVIPTDRLPAAVLAISLTATLGVAITFIGTEVLAGYGWGVFVGLPFCLGLTSTLIYSCHRRRSLSECLGVAAVAIALLAGLILVFAIEGFLCILMAAPVWVPCALFGAGVGYALQSTRGMEVARAHVSVIVLLGAPVMVWIEFIQEAHAPLRRVTTSLMIDANADTVWDKVVAFPAIREPDEFFFRAGIAYPLRATIEGRGVGAVRYCTFTTGEFVEPIEVWDEPRLLRFAVTHNPPTMQEWTFHDDVHPPHLVGFLVSQRGQFRLTQLSPNKTMLEGTTWYQNSMWPQAYWGLWSDMIIHAIHRRVLAHIRTVAEAQVQESSPSIVRISHNGRTMDR